MSSDDYTRATALLVAERRLIRLGWSHSAEDIGKVAAEILKPLPPRPEAGTVNEGEKK